MAAGWKVVRGRRLLQALGRRVPSVMFLFSGCLRHLCRKFHSVSFQFTPLDLNTYRCFKRALTSLSEIWQRLSSSLV